MEEERLNEAGAGAGHRHHRPRHRPVLPGQGRPASAASASASCSTPTTCASGCAPIVARKNRLLRAPVAGRQAVRRRRAVRRVPAATPSRCGRTSPTRRACCTTACAAGKRILFEAAQGSLLDVDHGTYPYVTSSNSSTAGVWSGSGVPARSLDRVIGVIKAYTTRVGRGPFPTELDDGPDGIGERIRTTGREYGTVTGRPRRCGWFDAVAVRYTAALGGADELAVMLLDVLSELDEVRDLHVAYELDGERIDHFPSDAFLLERCQPVYETLPGWRQDISAAPQLADLPAAARRYVDRLGELLGAAGVASSRWGRIGSRRSFARVRHESGWRSPDGSEARRSCLRRPRFTPDTLQRLADAGLDPAGCRGTSPSSWTATAAGPSSAACRASRATPAASTASAPPSRSAAGSASAS